MSKDAHKALIAVLLTPYGWLRSGEPLFRRWHKLPMPVRKRLKKLKSEDIATANWHLRKCNHMFSVINQ